MILLRITQILLLVAICINVYMLWRTYLGWKVVSRARKQVDDSLNNANKILDESSQHLKDICKLMGEMAGIHDFAINQSIDKSLILDDMIERLIMARTAKNLNKDNNKLH